MFCSMWEVLQIVRYQWLLEWQIGKPMLEPSSLLPSQDLAKPDVLYAAGVDCSRQGQASLSLSPRKCEHALQTADWQGSLWLKFLKWLPRWPCSQR